MHVDAEAVRKSVRTYMMIGAALLVFTGITVAANYLHLPIPAAITLALIIATIKASMVAAVFMHLNHEKQWIYGALILTVAFFIVLMSVPLFTTMDTFGKHLTGPAAGHAVPAGAPADEHAGH
jgi:cytochrome c oxidase subunit IV